MLQIESTQWTCLRIVGKKSNIFNSSSVCYFECVLHFTLVEYSRNRQSDLWILILKSCLAAILLFGLMHLWESSSYQNPLILFFQVCYACLWGKYSFLILGSLMNSYALLTSQSILIIQAMYPNYLVSLHGPLSLH